MFRLLLIALMLISSSTAMAANFDLPSFFTPAPEDLSVWYLGNIFGSELIAGPGIPDIALMSRLFSMFNQVALVVGIIIIIYTMLTGTLNTANEGKPLGEKWNSMWMPVRSLMGIGLLVPKGGSGYVLSQYIVMWLTLQGIGAADTIWNTMVTYFEEGGSIRQQTFEGYKTYLTQENFAYVYNLQGEKSNGSGWSTASDKGSQGFPMNLAKSAVCVDAFNADDETRELMKSGKYSIYLAPGDTYNKINFGDQTLYDPDAPTTQGAIPGAECGQVRVNLGLLEDESKASYDARTRVYLNALYNLARGQAGLSREIVSKGSDTNFEQFFPDEKRNAELFINYIVGYEPILAPDTGTQVANEYDTLRKYGWILAANYYTVLANLTGSAESLEREFVVPGSSSVSTEFAYTAPSIDYGSDYRNLGSFWDAFDGWDEKYTVQIEGEVAEDFLQLGQKKVGVVDFGEIKEALNKLGKQTPGNSAGRETRQRVEEYIRYLTGEGTTYETKSTYSSRRVAQDPVVRAANYGKRLMDDAIVLIVSLSVALTALNYGLAWVGACKPGAYFAQSLGSVLVPGVLALGVFMYTQGAMLGVFLPLIPFITFFIGALGWMMQVVESIAAAPIVALGLIFPETRDDIWGRAAPAYMLILNLFLRPSLMIVGFAAAMIMMWIATELLNLGFLMLVVKTFRVEDMFGFVTIMTAYTGLLIVTATKVYSLINQVPNKVLHWIGDQSMGVQGAEEAIGGAKQGTETGAGATAGGYSGLQKADTYRMEQGASKSGETADISGNVGPRSDSTNKADSGSAGQTPQSRGEKTE